VLARQDRAWKRQTYVTTSTKDVHRDGGEQKNKTNDDDDDDDGMGKEEKIKYNK